MGRQSESEEADQSECTGVCGSAHELGKAHNYIPASCICARVLAVGPLLTADITAVGISACMHVCVG